MRGRALSPGAWRAVAVVTAKFIAMKPARPGGQGAFLERRLNHVLVSGERCFFQGRLKKR